MKLRTIAAFTLCSPFLWGAVFCAAFYAALYNNVIENELLTRYFAGHPVEYCEAFLFFVGMAALGMKGVRVWRQKSFFPEGLFGSVNKAISPASSSNMLEQLNSLSSSKQSSYLVGRFRRALEYVKRNASAQGLEDELKYLTDLDESAMRQSYALSRIIVWAIPILGFLGTVIGITVAMGELGVSVSDGGDSLKNMLGGLSVAFDTTALALALSMVLMFTQYVIEGKENELLASVDQISSRELAGRFEVIPDGPEGELTALRKMMESILTSVEQSAARQALVWQNAFENTDALWQKRLEQTGDALRRNLAAALNQSLTEAISQTLTASLDRQSQAFLSAQTQLQQAVSSEMTKASDGFARSTQKLEAAQQSIAQQVETLGQMSSATDRIADLEDALNRNLTALAGSRNFEKTVMSLAAAIQLLSSRMVDAPAAPVRIETRKAA